MKKGPIILIILGLGLLAFLFYAPVEPSSSTQEEETLSTQESEESATSLSPNERVDQALQELQSGETPPMQAILKIRAVAEEYPENVKANFTLGLMSIQTGQYEKAVNRFNNVLKVEPQNIDAMQLLASVYLNLGDTTSAQENYSQALTMATDSAQRAVIQTELNNIN